MTLKTLQAKAHAAYNKVGDEILEGNSNLNAAELMDNFIDEIVASTIKEFGAEVEKEFEDVFPHPTEVNFEENNYAAGRRDSLIKVVSIIRSLTETV